MYDIMQVFDKAIENGKPYVVGTVSILNYLMFPDTAYMTAFVAVGCAMVVDLVTRVVAVVKLNGGFFKAIRTKNLTSKKLWEGTSAKIYAYLTIAIMIGLAYRVMPLDSVSLFIGNLIYTILFYREFQSVIENLCDYGFDLNWLLKWTKKKNKELMTELDKPSEPKDVVFTDDEEEEEEYHGTI